MEGLGFPSLDLVFQCSSDLREVVAVKWLPRKTLNPGI